MTFIEVKQDYSLFSSCGSSRTKFEHSKIQSRSHKCAVSRRYCKYRAKAWAFQPLCTWHHDKLA